jgi:hypothetical protein
VNKPGHVAAMSGSGLEAAGSLADGLHRAIDASKVIEEAALAAVRGGLTEDLAVVILRAAYRREKERTTP